MNLIQTEQLTKLATIYHTMAENSQHLELAAVKNYTAEIQEIFNQLANLQWPTFGEYFNYDSVNTLTDISEHITTLRVASGPLRRYLFDSGLWTLSNQIITQFKKALYQHASLQDSAFQAYPMPSEKSEQSLMAWAQAATRRASAASAAAEKATAKGSELLQKMENQYQQQTQIAATLITESQQQNQVIFIQNALAAIAADEAATALVEVEEWLNNNNK